MRADTQNMVHNHIPISTEGRIGFNSKGLCALLFRIKSESGLGSVPENANPRLPNTADLRPAARSRLASSAVVKWRFVICVR